MNRPLIFPQNAAGHGWIKQPAIGLWNEILPDIFDTEAIPLVGDTQTMKQQTIERWETDGGAVPDVHPVKPP